MKISDYQIPNSHPWRESTTWADHRESNIRFQQDFMCIELSQEDNRTSKSKSNPTILSCRNFRAPPPQSVELRSAPDAYFETNEPTLALFATFDPRIATFSHVIDRRRKVCVVENVEQFRSELHLEPLRDCRGLRKLYA